MRVRLQLTALGLLLMICIACRQDMHDQPRFKPLAMSDFYSDLRSARPQVEGTVARDQLHEDVYFYTGKMGTSPGDYMPFPVDENVLARGRERFDIYCAPCHSRLGDGNGMIPQRGFRSPPSYHTERLRKAPLGYFFDVMTKAEVPSGQQVPSEPPVFRGDPGSGATLPELQPANSTSSEGPK